ncbi:uncharacterized protein LOC121765165 [Salvia splendens]|uniref:uncharacterized protein LOC121765165 n=1 Tax=Salvia splendens TaxID=180675 RepID=UPI001C261871|nr:uncharacterized protein LOC121765165 [Salvia splendens]
MNLIMKEVQEIGVEAQLQQKPVAPLTTSYSTENVMVGFEQVCLEVLDRDQLNRQIIPITGMGGIATAAEYVCDGRRAWWRWRWRGVGIGLIMKTLWFDLWGNSSRNRGRIPPSPSLSTPPLLPQINRFLKESEIGNWRCRNRGCIRSIWNF